MAVDHHYTEQQTYSGLLHDPAKLDPLTGFHHQSYLDEVLNKKSKATNLILLLPAWQFFSWRISTKSEHG